MDIKSKVRKSVEKSFDGLKTPFKKEFDKQIKSMSKNDAKIARKHAIDLLVDKTEKMLGI